MNSQDGSLRLPEKAVSVVRIAWFVCAFSVAIVLLGALPGYYSHYAQAIGSDPYGLGQLNLPFQLLVGLGDLASGFISLILAALLFWRKPNDRMALFMSFFLLITAPPSGISLDYFLTTYLGASSVLWLGQNLQTPLWVLIWCIFPDGRFVPRWMRWAFLVSIATTLLGFAGAEWSVISEVVIIPVFIVVTVAQVYRYRRVSNNAERKQTKWVVFGFVVSILLSLIASLIYQRPGPPLLNVMPLALTVAILRSHLWDIDIIFRKTLIYAVLTALLAVIYLAGVVFLQRLFGALTGIEQSPLAVVISTLAIAALFTPLRRRIQNTIDRRFFRKKYDAQRVLAQFALTARDETDLDALTTELVRVVGETLQPEGVSVWIRDGRTRGQP